MVKNATGFGRSGLQDWLLQRLTAIILAAYCIFLSVKIFYSGAANHYSTWVELFRSPLMRGISFAALLSLIVHAWIGMWTVTTDYLNPFALRLAIQIFIIASLLSYLWWGIQILWGT